MTQNDLNLKQKTSSSFLKNLWEMITFPYDIIRDNKTEFTIWFLFTILTGQFGMLANIIVKCYAKNQSVAYSIYVDSSNGSFYTFSIALVASVLGPIFINFLNSKKIEFKTLKTFTIVISIFFLFIAGIIYASLQAKLSEDNIYVKFDIDWTQLTIYIVSICIVSYGYSVLKLESNTKKYRKLNDPIFSEEDDKKVEETIEKAKIITEDSKGNAL